MNKITSIAMVILLFVLSLSQCKHEEVELPPPPDTNWTEVPANLCDDSIYFENHIRKLIVTKCASRNYDTLFNNILQPMPCHFPGAKELGKNENLEHDFTDPNSIFDLFEGSTFEETDFYEALHPDSTENDPKKPMPLRGKLSEKDMDKIRIWFNNKKTGSCNPKKNYSLMKLEELDSLVKNMIYYNCNGCHNEATKNTKTVLLKENPRGPEDVIMDKVKIHYYDIVNKLVDNDSSMPKYLPMFYYSDYALLKKWYEKTNNK